MEQRACPLCGEELPVVADAFCPSCREPLDPVPANVPLAAPRRDVLLALLALRKSPPTIGGMFRRNIRRHLALIILLGGVAWLYSALGVGWAPAVLLGVLAGVLLGDLSWFGAVVSSWPTEATVIDWDKIERLVGDKGKSPNTPASAGA